MSRFLFVLFEGGGNVPAQLGIARRLAGRGHAVAVLGDPTLAPAARAAGCDHVAFPTAPVHDLRSRDSDAIRDWLPGSPIARLARTARTLMFGPAEAYARDVLSTAERWRPDAIAVDYMLFGALIGAERSGLPTAAIVHTIYPLPAAGVPPFGLGLAPARGPLGRLRDAVLRRAVARTFDRLGRPAINAARAALGLPLLASVFDQVQRSDRILVLTTASFDFAARARLPAVVVFTGPELDDPSWTRAWQSPWPRHAAQPLVVVALGSTFQDQLGAIQRAVDALATLPVRGLVTLGEVFDPGELRLPPNVVALRSAPHRQVLPEARAVISHAGHGTLLKALAHGVPVLAIPLGRDQADNAARLVETGAGLHLGPRASPRRIARGVTRILGEPAFLASARRIAADIARDVAVDRATCELEALAARHPHNTD